MCNMAFTCGETFTGPDTVKKALGTNISKAEKGKGCLYLHRKVMSDYVFSSLVLAMLRGLSDSVALVPSSKFSEDQAEVFRGSDVLFSAHPTIEGRGPLRQFDIMPLPYSLGTSHCHLVLCPRLTHLWAGWMLEKSAASLGVCTCNTCSHQDKFWTLSGKKGAKNCISDISSASPSSVSSYACLTKANFLSIHIYNYHY